MSVNFTTASLSFNEQQTAYFQEVSQFNRRYSSWGMNFAALCMPVTNVTKVANQQLSFLQSEAEEIDTQAKKLKEKAQNLNLSFSHASCVDRCNRIFPPRVSAEEIERCLSNCKNALQHFEALHKEYNKLESEWEKYFGTKPQLLIKNTKRKQPEEDEINLSAAQPNKKPKIDTAISQTGPKVTFDT